LGISAGAVAQLVLLERCDILHAVNHTAAELHELRAFSGPPPPLQRAVRDVPPPGQFFLIEVFELHLRLLSLIALGGRCEILLWDVVRIEVGCGGGSVYALQLSGERGEDYRNMIENCPAKRAGSPDEVAAMGAFLMGSDGAFITGSDILIDGGMTASYYYGDAASAEQNQ
jgi:hypothetical protein